MSGHSKWAQKKHKKAATDAKRGNLFAKLASAITVAAKDGRDPNMNSKLRLAVERARSFNMPLDNIERAIERAKSLKGSAELDSLLYEAYGPGGAAILVEAVTDNKNRTVADIKHVLAENGGKLAESGSVAWMFSREGVLFLPSETNKNLDSEETELAVIDAGAEDIIKDEGGLIILTSPDKRADVGEKITAKGFVIGDSSDEYVAKMPIEKLEKTGKDRLIKLTEALEAHDDVLNVWSNVTGL